MSVQSVGLRAYTAAMNNFTKAEKTIKSQSLSASEQTSAKNFSSVLESSLGKVNTLQQERAAMITSFAAGETQNVHELMIAMQKAGLAMNLTSAVRNKVMEAYKELSRMQF